MLRKLLPHAAIILSGMYFVFFFIDRVNAAMAFIDNPITKGLLLALGVLAVFNALTLIRDNLDLSWDAWRSQRESRRKRD